MLHKICEGDVFPTCSANKVQNTYMLHNTPQMRIGVRGRGFDAGAGKEGAGKEIGEIQTGSRQTESRQTGSRQTRSRQTGSRQTGSRQTADPLSPKTNATLPGSAPAQKKKKSAKISDRKFRFLRIWRGFGRATAKQTSKSASGSNFASDRLILRSVRPNIVKNNICSRSKY